MAPQGALGNAAHDNPLPPERGGLTVAFRRTTRTDDPPCVPDGYSCANSPILVIEAFKSAHGNDAAGG